MEQMIDSDRARELLAARVRQCGGVRAYARQLELSPSFISRCLSGESVISGKVAKDINVESVHQYKWTMVPPCPMQERYENQRRKYAADKGQPLERSKKMRVQG